MSQIHFVHEHKPGTSLDSTQVRALRSHVRKVNLERSNQKIAQRLENFRSLTIADFVQGGKTKSGKKRSYSSTDPGQTASPAAESPTPPDDIPTPSGSSINIIADVPTRAFESLLSHEGDTLPRECECSSPDPSDRHSLISGLLSGSIANYQPNEQHPYASQISRFVDIDERRIDSLLKSCRLSISTLDWTMIVLLTYLDRCLSSRSCASTLPARASQGPEDPIAISRLFGPLGLSVRIALLYPARLQWLALDERVAASQDQGH